MIHHIIARLAEMKMTNAVAAMGLVAPVWIPKLQSFNEFLALATPSVAAIWLVTQLFIAWYKWWRSDGK